MIAPPFPLDSPFIELLEKLQSEKVIFWTFEIEIAPPEIEFELFWKMQFSTWKASEPSTWIAPEPEFKKDKLMKEVEIEFEEGSEIEIIGAKEEELEFSKQFRVAVPLIPTREREEIMESWQFSGPE